jgi:heme O synthase-like polyprenyltransferase
MIGMVLALPVCQPGAMCGWRWLPALAYLVAGAAAAQCLVEQHIDARIAAHVQRPTARGGSSTWTFAFQPPCAQPGR